MVLQNVLMTDGFINWLYDAFKPSGRHSRYLKRALKSMMYISFLFDHGISFGTRPRQILTQTDFLPKNVQMSETSAVSV